MKKQYIMELFRLCGKTMSNQLFEKWRKKNEGMFEYQKKERSDLLKVIKKISEKESINIIEEAIRTNYSEELTSEK